MNDDEFIQNFGESIDRHTATSSDVDVMDVDSIALNYELHQIEREIDRCRPTLQNCRDKCENIEMEICDVKQQQRKAQFVLDNMQSEEENLHERFKNIRLNYEACVEKSGGYEDPNEIICARINELTMQRKELLKELVQLKRKADDNGKKLARVKAMIAEQEEKNATQIRELKEISESGVFISPTIRNQIDFILKHQETNKFDAINTH